MVYVSIPRYKVYRLDCTGEDALQRANMIFEQLRRELNQRCDPNEIRSGNPPTAFTQSVSYLFPKRFPRLRVDLRGTIRPMEQRGEVVLSVGYVGSNGDCAIPLEEIAKRHKLVPV